MNSHTQALVHSLVASQLRIDDATVRDADRLTELGLDPLNLVLVVLRLEDLAERVGSFPLGKLDLARTVGELVTLVDAWLNHEVRHKPTAASASRRNAGSPR